MPDTMYKYYKIRLDGFCSNSADTTKTVKTENVVVVIIIDNGFRF